MKRTPMLSFLSPRARQQSGCRSCGRTDPDCATRPCQRPGVGEYAQAAPRVDLSPKRELGFVLSFVLYCSCHVVKFVFCFLFLCLRGDLCYFVLGVVDIAGIAAVALSAVAVAVAAAIPCWCCRHFCAMLMKFVLPTFLPACRGGHRFPHRSFVCPCVCS